MEEKKTKGLQYLQQCWSALQTNKTLGLDFYLSAPSGTDDIPVMTLHDQFSRFTLTLIDNSGNERKIIRVNIRAREIPYLLEKYKQTSLAKFFHEMQAEKSNDGEDTDKPSPAYSVRIRAGAMKGKTPAEILLEDPTKESELVRHRDWLTGFLGKYPSNQEVIDAIDDAVYLLSANQLSASKTTGITVWEKAFKGNPNINSGTKTVSKIAITCEYGARNPWCVMLQNNEHPVVNGEVDMKTVINGKNGLFYLNDEQMAEFMYVLKSRTELFEMHAFGPARKFIRDNEWKPNQSK